MIYSLTGNLKYNDSSFIVIECGGVGFKCYISAESAKKIGKVGTEVFVFTYLSVREDALDLYAFATKDEMEFFKLLINVSGIGPKAAISILSIMDVSQLVLAIAAGDTKSIARASGVGKKSAERVVLELKDKVSSFSEDESVSGIIDAVSSDSLSPVSEAIEALVSLGYSQSDSARAVAALDKSLTADEMIRHALRSLAKNL